MASISFNCSSCNRPLKAGEDKVGKKMKCPDCSAFTPVPSAAAPVAVAAPAER